MALSRMRNMKGRSTVTRVGPDTRTTTAVAAAASVPSSSTDTNALWTTLETQSSLVPGHAGEISSGAECIRHSHFRQGLVQTEFRLQLE